jgi:hypothetical protein
MRPKQEICARLFVRREKECEVNNVMVVGSYNDSVESHLELAHYLKSFFPFLKLEDISVGKINGSGCMDSHKCCVACIPKRIKLPRNFTEVKRLWFNW